MTGSDKLERGNGTTNEHVHEPLKTSSVPAIVFHPEGYGSSRSRRADPSASSVASADDCS